MSESKFECYAKYGVYAIVVLLLMVYLLNGCSSPSNDVPESTVPDSTWAMSVTDSLQDTVYVGIIITDSVISGSIPTLPDSVKLDTVVPYHYHYYRDDYEIHYIVKGNQVVNKSEFEILENKQ